MEVSCPKCHVAMEPGYVTAGKGLKFRDSPRARLTIFGGQPIIGMWRAGGVPAARCSNCHIALIDYSQEAVA